MASIVGDGTALHVTFGSESHSSTYNLSWRKKVKLKTLQSHSHCPSARCEILRKLCFSLLGNNRLRLPSGEANRPTNDFLRQEPDAPISGRPGLGGGRPVRVVPIVIASRRNVLSPRRGRQRLAFGQVAFRRSLKSRNDLSLTQRASGGKPLSPRRCESRGVRGTPHKSH